ncbi:MAG: hypothetical protein IJF88_05620 [Oscillospiraceae bacterium]|nr:hypothetical protein [Oscillospiraceae bacterium]
MKNIEELPDRMVALIEAVEEASQGQDTPEFTPQAIEIVKEIAAYSKTTKAYQQQAERVAEFWAEPHTPADVWTFMLHKIVNAPFPLYRRIKKRRGPHKWHRNYAVCCRCGRLVFTLKKEARK